jgi:DNA-binding NtrC family response regulator
VKSRTNPNIKLALVVHPDPSVLSRFQEAFQQAGMATLLARDLPAALGAVSQNDFEVAVISWRIMESGDGWALGATLRRVFPTAFVVVLANETSVPTLKEAINQGFDELYDPSHAPEEVTAHIVRRYSRRRLGEEVVQ